MNRPDKWLLSNPARIHELNVKCQKRHKIQKKKRRKSRMMADTTHTHTNIEEASIASALFIVKYTRIHDKIERKKNEEEFIGSVILLFIQIQNVNEANKKKIAENYLPI